MNDLHTTLLNVIDRANELHDDKAALQATIERLREVGETVYRGAEMIMLGPDTDTARKYLYEACVEWREANDSEE